MPILSQFYDKSNTKSALPAPGQSKLRYILEDSVPRKPVKPLNAMEKRLWPVWSNVSFFLVLNSTSSGPLLFWHLARDTPACLARVWWLGPQRRKDDTQKEILSTLVTQNIQTSTNSLSVYGHICICKRVPSRIMWTNPTWAPPSESFNIEV